jgi:CBS domain containing-hemolysin-like protein
VALSTALIIVALIVFNAVYVAAEFSAVSARRSRIRQLADRGNPLATWLLPLVESPAALDRYIAACQIGITLSGLLLGAFAQRTIATRLAPLLAEWGSMQEVAAQSTAAAIVLLLLTVAQVIFAELVPKSLALQYPTQTALYTLVPMVPSLWLYRPFIRWLNGAGTLFLRLVGAPAQAHRHIHSPDEIELLIAESRDGGLLEPDEHQRLQRALRLGMRQAKQLMVSRRRIAAVDVETPLDQLIPTLAHSPYSRLPVYRGSIDNVIGMVHVKDLVRWRVTGGDDVAIASLVRPIATVHESVTADRVLMALRERRAHQALVVDEFGGTAGLVTLEDVISELLGKVADEFKSPQPLAERAADGRVRLPGSMSVLDAATLLETEWETDAATVGGLVVAGLGRLPAPGERATIGDYEFEVERVADRALVSTLARRRMPLQPETDQ